VSRAPRPVVTDRSWTSSMFPDGPSASVVTRIGWARTCGFREVWGHDLVRAGGGQRVQRRRQHIEPGGQGPCRRRKGSIHCSGREDMPYLAEWQLARGRRAPRVPYVPDELARGEVPHRTGACRSPQEGLAAHVTRRFRGCRDQHRAARVGRTDLTQPQDRMPRSLMAHDVITSK
jgi:hypothetical protein